MNWMTDPASEASTDPIGRGLVFAMAGASSIAVVIADAGRDGEIRYMHEFDASPESMTQLIRKLSVTRDNRHFCYEAGPTGYGLAQALTRPRRP
jgi:hypothetical protein